MASLFARLRAVRSEMGPLWWYALLTFFASRIGDLGNLFIGAIYLPSALSAEELGAVDPVTRLAGFATIPMAIIGMVGAKYLSTYHARNEEGKIKQFMRDMAFLGLVSAGLFVAVMLVTFEPIRIRLGVNGRFLLPALCAVAAVSCWQPLIQVVLQGMQKFYSVASLGVLGVMLRVALVLWLVPLARLSGFLGATFIAAVLAIGVGLWSLRRFIGKGMASVAYYADWRGILAYALPVTILTVTASFQGFIEPFVIKHFLSTEDAAGFYVVCRFGFIPGYLVGTISFVLFPLLSHRHERGEDTHDYLRQALLVTLLVCSAGTVVLGILSEWLFTLLPQWQSYAYYAPYMWLIGFQTTIDAAVGIYVTHEIACRRFHFLRVTVPLAVLDMAILYGSFGWGGCRAWVPGDVWQIVDQTVPRTLTYAVAIMCATRFLAVVGLALNWWAEERGTRGST